MKHTLQLEFENLVKSFAGTKKLFSESLGRAEKVLLKMPKFKKNLRGCVMLTLVNDRQIHALNRDYRSVDKPTDVLSFSYFGEKKFPEADVNSDTIGEIVISIPTAKKQAKDHKKTLNEELQFLFLHGLLHVFGFDHIKKNEREKMFDLQDKIIGNKSWRAIADREAEEAY